jgi:hypothetical protein
MLASGTTLVIAVAKGFEKWREKHHQNTTLRIVTEAQRSGLDVKPLVDLSKKYADVSIAQGLSKLERGHERSTYTKKSS